LAQVNHIQLEMLSSELENTYFNCSGHRALQKDQRPEQRSGLGKLHDHRRVDAHIRRPLLRGLRQATKPLVART
jgi:hypothetical protein